MADHETRLQATHERAEQTRWRSKHKRIERDLARVQENALDHTQTRLAEARAHAWDYAAREGDWWQRRHDALTDAAAARLELDRRTREQTREAIQAAPYEPAQYIIGLIGERHEARDVGVWDEAARRIEAYHHTHQPEALRIEPPGPGASIEQRHEWLDAREAITRTVGNLDWQRLYPLPSGTAGATDPTSAWTWTWGSSRRDCHTKTAASPEEVDMRPDHQASGSSVNLQDFMPAATRTHELLDRPLLLPTDVAKLLGIKRSTVYELARAGRIPSLRIGRAVRFLRADLEAWIQEQRPRQPQQM